MLLNDAFVASKTRLKNVTVVMKFCDSLLNQCNVSSYSSICYRPVSRYFAFCIFPVMFPDPRTRGDCSEHDPKLRQDKRH